MKRKFNTQGICVTNKHYMVDISHKLDKMMELIEDEAYFTINRPRQYGKTTTLELLERRLVMEGYLVISVSFEGIDDKKYEDSEKFIKALLVQFRRAFGVYKENKLIEFLNNNPNIPGIDEFGDFITELILEANKKIILLVDEVDKSCNNQLFLTFLGMLRNKYLLRSRGRDTTFHSVILAGVHDVKTLKLKLRPEDERKYNSPWNIAANFEVDMSFNPEEISTMLTDYSQDKEITMDIGEISWKLYYYTSGYPFLVSRLCEIIDTKIMKNNVWGLDDVDNAVKILLKESNPNFDDLIKNVENNAELYEFTQKILIDGDTVSYVFTDNIISLGVMFGILKDASGRCAIGNKIYELLLYDHMMLKKIRREQNSEMSSYNYRDNFIENGILNMEKLILKFQQFMREEYSKKNQAFLEREGRLILLAFIKPIINGVGFDFKEVQISEEKRLDIVITYLDKKYVLELKRWYGESTHEKGIKQLCDYLDRVNLEKGYLIVFDFKDGKESRKMQDVIAAEGKEIFMVRV